jgi:hypothetical protein
MGEARAPACRPPKPLPPAPASPTRLPFARHARAAPPSPPSPPRRAPPRPRAAPRRAACARLVRRGPRQQRRVHVGPVAGYVEHQEPQKRQAGARVERAQQRQQARRRDAVGHHVQQRAQRAGLAERARRAAVELVAHKAAGVREGRGGARGGARRRRLRRADARRPGRRQGALPAGRPAPGGRPASRGSRKLPAGPRRRGRRGAAPQEVERDAGGGVLEGEVERAQRQRDARVACARATTGANVVAGGQEQREDARRAAGRGARSLGRRARCTRPRLRAKPGASSGAAPMRLGTYKYTFLWRPQKLGPAIAEIAENRSRQPPRDAATLDMDRPHSWPVSGCINVVLEWMGAALGSSPRPKRRFGAANMNYAPTERAASSCGGPCDRRRRAAAPRRPALPTCWDEQWCPGRRAQGTSGDQSPGGNGEVAWSPVGRGALGSSRGTAPGAGRHGALAAARDDGTGWNP